jgi:hypothetical protein
MSPERKAIFDKVNELIEKRKKDLLDQFPSIHEIDDGIIIRFFTDWDNCHTNELIRYKKVVDEKRPEDITIFYYIPKGAEVAIEKRPFIKDMACLSGKLELHVNGDILHISGFKKFRIDTDEFFGKALEDTYVLTTNRA